MNHKLLFTSVVKVLFAFTLFFLFVVPVFSQTATNEIVGLVNDANGNAIVGASVVVKNSTTGFTAGTTTDSTGKFYFKNLPLGGPYSFEVSAINYETQSLTGYTIKNRDKISLLFTIKQAITNLNDVVVVGYNDKKRSELTSSVVTISSDKLKDVTTNDVGSMLQGKVPGLQVVNSSGAPGATAEIRLRGVSSINASQDPLYVVDGIIGGDFDPNDVETISVLKDAGATAMYGSQANGGVIVVTTKKSKTSKTNFEFKIADGIRTPDFGSMKLMNGTQLYEYQKEFYRDYIPSDTGNSYKIDLLKFYDERPLTLRNQNYNWLSDMFKHAPMQNIYLSASGRTEKADYYVGLTYYNEVGTFLNTKYNRINLRANSTYRFSNKVNVTNNINLSAYQGKSYNYNDVYYAYLNMPWDNPYDSLGSPVYVDGSSTFKWWSRDKTNPIHTVHHSDYPYKGFDMNYDLVFNWNILKWLMFTSSNRFSAAVSKSTTYIDAEAAGTYHNVGYLNEQSGLNYGIVNNDLFKFKFDLNNSHKINGLVGFAYEGSWDESMGAEGKGLPPGLRVLDVVSSNQAVSGSNNQEFIQSLISQLNYSYADKYFLTASYRYDGSSNFPPSKRYGSFPSFSAAWLISDEPFMKNVKQHIDILKLRASWGITGTQSIGSSRYLGLFSLSSKYNSSSAAIPYQLPSSNLTWESKNQINIGVDIGLFKRINLSIDVYDNTTKNLLVEVSQPLSVGFENKWENVGKILNKGVEFAISTVNILRKNFEWNTDFNISYNSNKLQNFSTQLVKTGSWSISQIYRNGGNLYEFYMPKWSGVDPQTGAPLWEILNKDANGNVIGKQTTSDISQATYQEVGSALPTFQGSITSRWRYKNISLSVNAYFLTGNKVYSNNLTFVMNDGHEPYYNQILLPKGYSIWSHPGDIATNPSPQNCANSNETSTRYLMDGSFISLRNITLSYELPQSFIKKLNMKGVSVAFTADNLHTFTNFLGQDPQTTITPGTYVTPGVSDFKYPNNRQYLLSIGLRF